MVTNNSSNIPTGASGTLLQGAGVGTAPSYTTSTYPATNAINTLLYASSANVMAALATANTAMMSTNSSGVPSWQAGTSWTPAIAFGGGTTNITYSLQAGTYVQCGPIVFFNFHLTMTNKGTSTGNATLTGFPVSTNGNGNRNAMLLCEFVAITFDAGFTNMGLQFNNSAATALIIEVGSNKSAQVLQDTNFVNNSEFTGNGFYFII